MDLEIGDHRLVINPKGVRCHLPCFCITLRNLTLSGVSRVLDLGDHDLHDLGTRTDEDLALARLFCVVDGIERIVEH